MPLRCARWEELLRRGFGRNTSAPFRNRRAQAYRGLSCCERLFNFFHQENSRLLRRYDAHLLR